MDTNKCSSLWFSKPYHVEIIETPTPEPGDEEVLVKSIGSAISAGTEMLAFQGMLPEGISLDTGILELNRAISYPFKYGYSLVGIVEKVGREVSSEWLGKKVFSFHPHESHFLSSVDELLIVPDTVNVEDALFLANMETAVSLLLDGAPLLGERVLVLGLGVVGQLLTALLRQFPLSQLTAVDPIAKRRLAVLQPLLPANDEFLLLKTVGMADKHDFDLVYETSGATSALNDAIQCTGYKGRIIVGSWYGLKNATLDLGSHFHRSKISIYASQVSSIDPSLAGRWDKGRRMSVAFNLLQIVKPNKLVTHQYSIDNAEKAYTLLEESEEPLQVILTY